MHELLAVAVRRARVAKAEPKVIEPPIVETPKPKPMLPPPPPKLAQPSPKPPKRKWLLIASEPSSGPSLNEICLAVGTYFDLPRSALRSHRRAYSIVRPRQICMYLARKLTRLSLPQIGLQMGGFDHSTTHHATEKIAKLRKTDPKIDDAVTAIMAKLSETK